MTICLIHNLCNLTIFLRRQGFLEKAMAKVSATLEAEAVALAGIKVEIMVRVLVKDFYDRNSYTYILFD